MSLVTDAHQTENLRNLLSYLSWRLVQHLHSESHIFKNSLLWQKPEILENSPYLASEHRNLPVGKASYLKVSYLDSTLIGIDFLQNQFNKSGLPSPAGTHQKHKITFINMYADIVKANVGTVFFSHMIKSNHFCPPILYLKF